MRHLRLALPFFLVVAGCRPPTTLPERLVLTTSTLPLEWGEKQTVVARAYVGTKPQNVDGLTWTSSDETIATVTPGADGEVTVQGVGGGTATVTAKLREATAEVTVTVAPRVIVLERIEVTAEMPTLPRGLKLQLTATGHYNDGTTKDLTASCAWASGDSSKATISGSGLVTGLDVGAVELRSLKSGVVGTLQLTITAATLSSIDVRPASTSLALGTTQAFTATGRFSDASSQNLSSMVTWGSSDATKLSVDSTGRATTLQLGTADVTAAFQGLMGAAHVTITDAALQTLEANPAAFTLPLGSSRAVTVSGHYSDGTMQDLTSMATWRSGTAAVATVDDGGVVTAVGQGLSVVTASVGAISTTTSVTCTAAQLQALQVAPQAPSVPLGLTRAMSALGVYTDNSTRDLTQSVTWSSADGGVATVSNLAGENGLVRTVSEGAVAISASTGTITGSTVVTVAPAILVSMQLSPATVSLAAGLTQQLTADGTYSNGSQRDVTALVTWTSADAGVATVSNDAGTEGLVTAVAAGTTTIDATLGIVTASRTVVVGAPALQRIDVTAPSTSVAKGRTLQLTATGRFSDGSSQVLSSGVSWTPTTGTTFTVNGSGLLTSAQLGTANATATVGGVSGSLSVTVTAAEIDSIALTPATPSIALGLTQAMVARATYSDGTQTNLTSGVTWSTVDSGIATVSSSGLVSSVAIGQTLVSASSGGVTGSTQLTVVAPVLVSIALTPSTLITLNKTQTQQVTALGTLSNGQTQDVTSTATWSSTTPAVASVSSAGLVTALAAGNTTITATQAGVSGSVPVTVNRPALQSLAVTPVNPHVQRGSTLAFTATATYVDSTTEDVTSLVTWGTSDASLATISALGVARGLLEGTVTISAQWNSQNASTSLTVDPIALVSIAVSGVSRFANGTAVQLVATGTYADSSTADLTALVTWASASPAVVDFVNASGVFGKAMGLSLGSANVTATFASVTSPVFAMTVLDTNPPYSGRCGTGLVISQVYGAGGNTGATLRNDFVELHNPTPNPISLNGYSIQYTSSAGNSWGTNLTTLSNVSVPAGGYYLVMMASGGANGTVFAGDQNSTINMSATSGKVLLANVTTALTGTCPTTNVVDFVGFGSGNNCFEGTAGTPAPSTTTSILRGQSGCRDANQNSTDFTVSASGSITPRSLSTTGVLCSCSLNGVGAPDELNACQLLGGANVSVNAGAVSSTVSASVTQPGVTDSAGFGASLRVQVGFGPAASSPATASGWRWWPAVGAVAGATSDQYDGVFVGPVSGTYGFTARASVDGVNWTSCDLNGAGSGPGLALEVGQLGVLTVP
ncbi:MAG: Ig-like domain-containing protein [Myxococcaceae bacterium]